MVNRFYKVQTLILENGELTEREFIVRAFDSFDAERATRVHCSTFGIDLQLTQKGEFTFSNCSSSKI
jgi:hypothetical protein